MWYMDSLALLRDLHLRVTPSRKMILSYIITSHKPVSINEIQEYLKKQNYSLDEATVYRTIHTLLENNLIKQIDFHEGMFRYEAADLPHHHHIICTGCGSVADADDCLKEKTQKVHITENRYSVSSHSPEFFGLCLKCQHIS